MPSVQQQMNIRQYLKSLRSWLSQGEATRFVLGNSGADYDSVVGSLVYAFYMTTSLRVVHLPLIDCPEPDLPLRFQVMTVLDSLQISPGDLLYTNMIPNLYTEPNHTFLLYDHNMRKQVPEQRIVQIVDHHAYEPAAIKCRHVINHCGSALTLLYYLCYREQLGKFEGTELYGKFMEYLGQGQPIAKFQDQQSRSVINLLMYYGILIDTYGLSQNQSQVWNQFDQQAINALLPTIKPQLTFDDLGAAKFDTQRNLNLTFSQQQRKDYKFIKYNNFAIHYSTILLNIDLFVQKYRHELSSQLAVENMKEGEIHAFMFSFPAADRHDVVAGKFSKFVMFRAMQQGLMQGLDKMLAEIGFLKHGDVDGWRKWSDPTGKISRKIFDKEVRARL